MADAVVNTTEPRYSWTQPICERDWIAREGTWDTSDRGDPTLSVRIPLRLAAGVTSVERCSWCGEPTIFGTFVRANPQSVPYPAVKED
jgi:hypothetical protein